MDHALLMRRGQARAQLPRNLQRFFLRQSSNPPQQRGQIFAVHILHAEVGQTIGFADVVHAAHIGVRDLPCGADFVAEAV